MRNTCLKLHAHLLIFCLLIMVISCKQPEYNSIISPLHLDDIHYIVSNEADAVDFFKRYFNAREMAHPRERFDLVRFLSLKPQEPTITITKIGPYADLPADRNKRWVNAQIISPKTEKRIPVYGSRWLAISTPSLLKARKSLLEKGAVLSEANVKLPMEPETPAFSIYGPDSTEIVLVERKDKDFGESDYAIDHIQFLVKEIQPLKAFYEDVLSANMIASSSGSLSLQVVDVKLVLSEPKALNIDRTKVQGRKQENTIRIGLDHLGFLQGNIHEAVEQAERKGYTPIFQPKRYVYKNKPTVYTFTAFSTPEDFNIEFVQVEGRIGPHAYYDCQ